MVARLFPDHSLLCHRRHVAGLYEVNSNSNHCFFYELSSPSTGVRHIEVSNVQICKAFPAGL